LIFHANEAQGSVRSVEAQRGTPSFPCSHPGESFGVGGKHSTRIPATTGRTTSIRTPSMSVWTTRVSSWTCRSTIVAPHRIGFQEFCGLRWKLGVSLRRTPQEKTSRGGHCAQYEAGCGREAEAATALFTTVGDEALTFSIDAAGFQDEETGSLWRIAGLAIEGPLAGPRWRDRRRCLCSVWVRPPS
jgi:hypothetical protein